MPALFYNREFFMSNFERAGDYALHALNKYKELQRPANIL